MERGLFLSDDKGRPVEIDAQRVLRFDISTNNLLCKERFDMRLNKPFERSCTVGRIVSGIDDMFLCVKTDLIELIKKDGRNGDQAIELMMVAKYLERIGDHAVNVAEWTKYNETGLGRVFVNSRKKSLPFSNIFVVKTPSKAPS